ncbi:MAG: cytochrome c maturation protein CcmE domain-containing protein [Candidatus Hodarchaeales archaeon]|jgi:cytochrome c-type biogenesis protein CcmE
MAISKNMIFAGVILLVCSGALVLLIANTSIPIFSVKEIMEHPQAESYLDRKIQLVGNVRDQNDTHFSINDPDDVNNASLIITIESINVIKPSGFQMGKTVLIEGKLLEISSVWLFKASLISTKCPSKYQN